MKDILKKLRSGFGRKKNRYYPKGNYQYQHVSRFNDIDSYSLLIRNTELTSVETDKDIRFSHHLTFGLDYKYFLKRLGRPNSVIKQTEPFERRILYYKFMMGGHKTKCELHFYKNKLFFYCYTFPYLVEEDKKRIINVLCEKYVNGPIDMEKFKIVDQHNNIIFVNDIVDLTVNYIDSRSELFTSLNPSEPVTENKTEKRVRRFKKELFYML
jgi:hypothetical protein